MPLFPVWVTDLMGRRFERLDVDGSQACRDLTTSARRLLIDGSDYLLYHYGTGSVIPADGGASIGSVGVRPGDVLFVVPETWSLDVCGWLAEETLDAVLTGSGRRITES